MPKLPLSQLYRRCSHDARHILAKLPRELRKEFYDKVPDEMSGRMQALALECELSRARLKWKEYVPEAARFRVCFEKKDAHLV